MTLFLYGALALSMLWLGADTPLASAVRQRLARLADALFSKQGLRILAALLVMILIGSLASRQPWLIGMAGMTDVTLFLDAAILSMVLGAAAVIKTAVEHAVRLRPWGLVVRLVRALGARQRRTPGLKRPSRRASDDDEPAPGFALALAA